jgi:hypothetical protein
MEGNGDSRRKDAGVGFDVGWVEGGEKMRRASSLPSHFSSFVLFFLFFLEGACL